LYYTPVGPGQFYIIKLLYSIAIQCSEISAEAHMPHQGHLYYAMGYLQNSGKMQTTIFAVHVFMSPETITLTRNKAQFPVYCSSVEHTKATELVVNNSCCPWQSEAARSLEIWSAVNPHSGDCNVHGRTRFKCEINQWWNQMSKTQGTKRL